MLFTYHKNSKRIKKCNQTDFKSHNILERQDIEKWIEDYPDILGEKLLVVTTEYDKFDKTNERLDLLAIDTKGNLVIVELKRDDSGKNVDLQAIKYAAYCSTLTIDQLVKEYQEYHKKKNLEISEDKARQEILDFIEDDDFSELNNRPRIIIASRSYRPEVTASILWLRNFGIDITCIKLSPYEIDNENIGLESAILIPLPEAQDYIIKTEIKENIEHVRGSIQNEEYLNFYKELIIRMPGEGYRQPQARSYYQIPTGVGGLHFEWAFYKRSKSFGVELHFEKSSKEQNINLINKIKATLKDKLEKEFSGNEVVFEENWGERWSKIYIIKDNITFNEELKIWAIEKMKLFIEIAQPEISKLK